MDYFTPRFTRQDEGSVLILVLLITSLLATAAWSFSDSVDAMVENSRDEGGALRAALAAEAGMEYAQRRLTLEPTWTGTGEDGVLMADGTAYFIVEAYTVPYWGEEDPGHPEGECNDPNCWCHQYRYRHQYDHGGCDHEGDEGNHNLVGCSHDHDGDGLCDHDGHHVDDDGDCDLDEDGDDDCGHDHDEDGFCDHHGNHVADDEDPDSDCDHDDDGADDCGHDHDGDGFCDHFHDGDGCEEDAKERDFQLSLVQVIGRDGSARAQLGAAIEVYPGEGGTADLALIFLGKNYHMLRTNVLGDALFVDVKNKVNDWVFDDFGVGRYQPGGSTQDGNTNLVQSSISGTLYKYREDHGTYQDLGAEEVIVDNAIAPRYDLSDFLTPGSGKTIYTGVTSLTGVYLEGTAVFRLNAGEKLTLSGCTFAGGVVIDCPTDFTIRNGYRNRLVLTDGTMIGGGSLGSEANIGLLAPGTKLTSAPCSSYTVQGFTYVNAIGAMKNTTFHGQLVVLNQVSNLKDSAIVYDETVAMAPPQSVGFGRSSGTTNILAMYENFN